MAQQNLTPTTQELRHLFGELSNQAANIASSFQACGCNANTQATDGQDLGVMSQNLMAVRQRVGGYTCGPPCDGISVDDPSDEALEAMPARLESQASALDENTAPCEYSGSPRTIETPAPVRAPLTLMRLPPEIRGMIWWATLAPEARFVDIRAWKFVWFGTRVRARNAWFHPDRSSVGPEQPWLRWSYERQGESWNRDAGWALLLVSRQVYEEAENEYWRRSVGEGLMFSFTFGTSIGNYYGIAAAWAFFNDCREQYLQAIRRIHLDLRRQNAQDGPHGAAGQAVVVERSSLNLAMNFAERLDPLLDLVGSRLTGLRHLSLTIGGWVPDVRQTPVSGSKWQCVSNGTDSHPQWIEGPAFPRPQSSEHWVTRLQNVRGLTRLRLRVVFAPRNAVTILNLSRDPGVLRTTHFLSMLRSSMLVNGDALGIGNVRVWLNYNEHHPGYEVRTRVVVQCDDSWDEDTGQHGHHEEDDDYDPLDGSNLYHDVV